ncbi:MAG: hypothetical protein M1409_09915 [Actinobacteria bacterium]|nr:hypothetical protein [Actinomycetota bacterium]
MLKVVHLGCGITILKLLPKQLLEGIRSEANLIAVSEYSLQDLKGIGLPQRKYQKNLKKLLLIL